MNNRVILDSIEAPTAATSLWRFRFPMIDSIHETRIWRSPSCKAPPRRINVQIALTLQRPLRIRSDIRDQFQAPTCAIQKSFKTLEGVVGLKVSCNLEWEMLWTELKPKFPDKATFVPSIATVISAWCDVLSTRLEDVKFAEWTEELIGKLESVRSIKLNMHVCPVCPQRPPFGKNNVWRCRTILDPELPG